MFFMVSIDSLMVAFEPNPRKTKPDWEKVSGAGEKRFWRIEKEFDKTKSDNGFQNWDASTTLLVTLLLKACVT